MITFKDININLEVRLFKSLIVPIATNAAETWILIEKDKKIMKTFKMRRLQSMLGVTLLNGLKNETISDTLGIKNTTIETITKMH